MADFQFGRLCLSDVGIRIIKPCEQSLQVSHPTDGSIVITFSETGRDAVLFQLTPEQRDHFVGLLIDPADASRMPEKTAA